MPLSSNNDDSSSYDHEREKRHREEAKRERAKNERKKKLDIANENFLLRGESIGSALAQSLSGWIDVKFEKLPAFAAKLNSSGYKINHTITDEKTIQTLLLKGDSKFDETRENLKTYSNFYVVKLQKEQKLIETSKELEIIESELDQIMKIKVEIYLLKSNISAQM